jgi:hypothetical protein
VSEPLVLPLKRSIGCAVLLAVPVLAGGSAAVNYWVVGDPGLDRLIAASATTACVLLLLVIFGFRSRLVVDGQLRTAEKRQSVLGIPLGRTAWRLADAREVEVLSNTTEGESASGASHWTTWYKVRVGEMLIDRNFTDDAGKMAATTLARRIAEHLELPVVEKAAQRP